MNTRATIAAYVWLCAVCSCAATGPRGASARTASPEAVSQAARAFDLGTSAYGRGEKLVALAHFESALRFAPSAAVLFNLARLHDELHHDETAARLYLSYLQSLDGATIDVAREAAGALTRLAPRVGWVVLRGDPRATIDGLPPVATSRGDIAAVAPGVRVVQFGSGATLSVRLRAGEALTLECGRGAPTLVSPATIDDLHLASVAARRSAP